MPTLTKKDRQQILVVFYLLKQIEDLDKQVYISIKLSLILPTYFEKEVSKLNAQRRVCQNVLYINLKDFYKTVSHSKGKGFLNLLTFKQPSLSPNKKRWLITGLYCLGCTILVFNWIPCGFAGGCIVKGLSFKALNTSHKHFYSANILAFQSPDPKKRTTGLTILVAANGICLAIEQAYKHGFIGPCLFGQYLVRSAWSSLNTWVILDYELLGYLFPEDFKDAVQPILSTLSRPIISRSAALLTGLPAIFQYQIVTENLILHENNVVNSIAHSVKTESLKPEFIKHFVKKQTYYRFMKSAQEKIPFDYVGAPVSAVIDLICVKNDISPCLHADTGYRLEVFKTLVENTEKLPDWGVNVVDVLPELKDLIKSYGSKNF